MLVSLALGPGIARIRAIPAHSCTGLSMYEDVDRAEAMREAGASAYLSKGGPSKELLAAVRSAADGLQQP